MVEDNPSDVELALFDLEDHNIANVFHIAKNAAQALDYLFDKDECLKDNPPKAIFLDLNLPGMNGMGLLSFLKSHEQAKGIPVVVLTSSNFQPVLEECRDLGASGFIEKPLEYDNFISALKEIGICTVAFEATNAAVRPPPRTE